MTVQAHQEWTIKRNVLRWAMCPLHEKRTSNFLGPVSSNNEIRWTFRCTYSDHVFAAIPDRNTPKPGQELAWIKRQEQLKLQKASKQQ